MFGAERSAWIVLAFSSYGGAAPVVRGTNAAAHDRCRFDTPSPILRTMRFPHLPTASLAALALAGSSFAQSQPAVIVRIENLAPDAGTFLTPLWVGFQDGSFDLYDTGALASALPFAGSFALERMAEDGDLATLITDFATLQPGGPQGVIRSNGAMPPIAPGASVARLFQVDPSVDRYFSYASMVLPSNDAFIANANPKASELFNAQGAFVGNSFVVSGTQVRDAGTEVNDELPATTAFFGQQTPDTGVATSDPIAVHPGFAAPNQGGILADPMFANADFTQPGYELLRVSFTEVDRGGFFQFGGILDASQAVAATPVSSAGVGTTLVRLDGASNQLQVVAAIANLTGPITVAHLHVGRAGENGPVVLDLTPFIVPNGNGGTIQSRFLAAALTGPFANEADAFGALLAEAATGGIYLNVHTAQNPGGEVRAQLRTF